MSSHVTKQNKESVAKSSREQLAGDLRRTLAASERLVLMSDAAGVTVHPCERRDLAVLLLHAEMPERALVELRAFSDSQAAQHATAEVVPHPSLQLRWSSDCCVSPIAARLLSPTPPPPLPFPPLGYPGTAPVGSLNVPFQA